MLIIVMFRFKTLILLLKNLPNKKILFRDIAIDVSDDDIIGFPTQSNQALLLKRELYLLVSMTTKINLHLSYQKIALSMLVVTSPLHFTQQLLWEIVNAGFYINPSTMPA